MKLQKFRIPNALVINLIFLVWALQFGGPVFIGVALIILVFQFGMLAYFYFIDPPGDDQ